MAVVDKSYKKMGFGLERKNSPQMNNGLRCLKRSYAPSHQKCPRQGTKPNVLGDYKENSRHCVQVLTSESHVQSHFLGVSMLLLPHLTSLVFR